MRVIRTRLVSTVALLFVLTTTAFVIPASVTAEIAVASPSELLAVQRQAPATAVESKAAMARQILDETNLARTQPGRYAGYLREMRARFVGKAYRLPNSTTMVMTAEGVPAVDEAIAFLSRQKPMHALSWSPGLAEAAEELIRDQGKSGQTGHDGNSGGMRERVERHGTWSGRIGENIGYGPNTARLMVMELIIDDGVPDRGHRKNIFSSHFKTAGAACGPHPVYRNMCVMEFATIFKTEKK
jgi:uncharacterized protein YkwD